MEKKAITSLSLAVILFSWIATVTASTEFVVYISNDNGFSIRFPSSWEKREGVGGSVVAALSPQTNPADQFRPNANVIVKDLHRNATLEEYMHAVITYMNKQSGFQIHDKGQIKINSSDAGWILYSQRRESINFKVLTYILVQKRRAYQITCTATVDQFARYKKKFEDIAQTFKFEY